MKLVKKIIGRGFGVGLLILVLWLGMAAAALVDNGDGTISDTETGLMWQRDEAGAMDWQAALAYCENLVLPAVGGYDDWRLPDRNELQSLINYAAYNPATYKYGDGSEIFPDVHSSNYWSSTTYASYTYGAWLVYFYYGYVDSYSKSYSYYVRAVRSGQSGLLGDLVISFPDSGETLIKSRYYTITWNSSNVSGNIQIDLYKGGTAPENMVLQLAAAAPNTGSYPFNPPLYLANDSDYYIGISAENGTVWDFSDTPFTIADEYQALPDHFLFSPIDSPQTADVSFTVTMTAMDVGGNPIGDFSGKVMLSFNVGLPNPTSVWLENGTAEFQVVMDTPCNHILTGDYLGITGSSNMFTVAPDVPCQGSLTSKVVDSRGDGVWEAWVTLFDDQGQQVGTTKLTDESGTYYFSGLACGRYEIRVEKIVGMDIVHNREGFIADITDDNINKIADIVLPLNAGTYGTPVILIPGILGSSSGPRNWPYPKLSSTIPDPYLHIHDPIGVAGFNHLRTYLLTSGFEVFACPWDWRYTADAAYEKFFLPMIDYALCFSTTGKVHVVAHSMGGLVVRAYIQSGDYRGDIGKFAMVGTPNLGSSNPYYIWEGGDPKLIDDIVDEGVTSIVNFYTNTIQSLWEETYSKKGWSTKPKKHQAIRDFVHFAGRSLWQLMGTEDFLYKPLYQEWLGITSDGNENSWLKALNNDPVIAERMSRDGSDGRVHVGVFAGKYAESTIKRINVGSPRGLYSDGGLVLPKKINIGKGDGDKTVPYDSAVWPAVQGWAELVGVAPAEHAGLIKAFTENGDIYNFLTDGFAASQQLFAMGIEGVDEADAELTVSINAGMRLCVVDPMIRGAGVDPVSRNLREEIPETELFFDSQGGHVSIVNPQEGTYSVSLFGEVARDYLMNLSCLMNGEMETATLKGFCPAGISSFVLSIDGTVQSMMTITLPVGAPSDLVAEPYPIGEQLMTRLTWNVPPGGDLASYTIYSAKEVEPYYAAIGTVMAGTTSFDTGQPWSFDPSIPVRTYVVTSVKNDGSESFFSPEVQNNDRDYDGLIDVDEIIAATGLDNPDTDGDGLEDGEEKYLGTSPLEVDTDADGYSDYDEILAGSDPLDDGSIPNLADSNLDGDVDGLDLVAFAGKVANGSNVLSVADFAAAFGR